MFYINKNNLTRFLEIGGAKIVGFSIISYSILFIAIFGGVIELGRFSAVGAILSPLTMFVTFRYIELIGISSDKAKTFTDLVVSAFSIYFILAVVIGIGVGVYHSNEIRLHDYFLMVVYKSVELFGDMLAVVLIQIKRGRDAARVALYKMGIVFILSMILHFYIGLSILNAIYISLIVGFLAVFLLVEIGLCKKYNLITYGGRGDIFRFIKLNYSLGLFNALMSLNSVIPRYYILYFGDLRQLGIFSLIYQISSVSVNFLEYAAGIYVKKIANIFAVNGYVSWLILSSYVAAFALMLSGLALEGYLQLAYFAISTIAMFTVLMGRGVSVVICLGLGVRVGYAGLMLASMLAGCVVIYIFEYISIVDDKLFLAFLYVLIASSAFGLILLNMANKEVRGG